MSRNPGPSTATDTSTTGSGGVGADQRADLEPGGDLRVRVQGEVELAGGGQAQLVADLAVVEPHSLDQRPSGVGAKNRVLA